jgi:hypothetical protein
MGKHGGRRILIPGLINLFLGQDGSDSTTKKRASPYVAAMGLVQSQSFRAQQISGDNIKGRPATI